MSHFGRAGPPDIRDTHSLLVLNITFRTSADDLFPLFDRYGKVVDIFIPRDRRTGESRGFAFVRYKYADEAQKAIERLDGRNVDGRDMVVQYAKYGREMEIIQRGRITQASPKPSRSRSRSPRRSSRRYREENRDRDNRRGSRSRDRFERDRHREGRERGRSSRRRSPTRSHSRSRDRGKEDVRRRSRSISPVGRVSPVTRRSPSRGRSASPNRSPSRSLSRSPRKGSRSGEPLKDTARNGDSSPHDVPRGSASPMQRSPSLVARSVSASPGRRSASPERQPSASPDQQRRSPTPGEPQSPVQERSDAEEP